MLDPDTRARRAREIMADPLMEEALGSRDDDGNWRPGAIEQNGFTAWQAENDPAMREEIWRRLQAMRTFRNYLEGVLSDAKKAAYDNGRLEPQE